MRKAAKNKIIWSGAKLKRKKHDHVVNLVTTKIDFPFKTMFRRRFNPNKKCVAFKRGQLKPEYCKRKHYVMCEKILINLKGGSNPIKVKSKKNIFARSAEKCQSSKWNKVMRIKRSGKKSHLCKNMKLNKCSQVRIDLNALKANICVHRWGNG